MTSYTPSTYYNSDGSVSSSANVTRLTQYDTSDEIHFTHSGNLSRRFKFTISTNTWSDASSNSVPGALSNGITSTTPSTFGGDVSGTPQPAIIGMCGNTGGSIYGGFANPFYTGSSGDGTNTEGAAAVFTGGLSVDSNGDLAAFIAASSPSGNYWIVEGTTPRNGINHVILTATYQLASGWSTGNTSTWYLQDGYGNVLDTFKANKKVFCNFW